MRSISNAPIAVLGDPLASLTEAGPCYAQWYEEPNLPYIGFFIRVITREGEKLLRNSEKPTIFETNDTCEERPAY